MSITLLKHLAPTALIAKDKSWPRPETHKPDVLLRALVMQTLDHFLGGAWPALRFGERNRTVLRPGYRLSRGTPFKRLRAGPLMTGIFYRPRTGSPWQSLPERPQCHHAHPTMLVPRHDGPTTLVSERRLITAASTGPRQVSGCRSVRRWRPKPPQALYVIYSTSPHSAAIKVSTGRSGPVPPMKFRSNVSSTSLRPFRKIAARFDISGKALPCRYHARSRMGLGLQLLSPETSAQTPGTVHWSVPPSRLRENLAGWQVGRHWRRGG